MKKILFLSTSIILLSLIFFCSSCKKEDPDLIFPVVKILGDNPIEILLNSEFDDPGAEYSDNIAIYSTRVVSNLNVNEIGSYKITYIVLDDAGNETTCSFDVLVNAYVGVENMKHNSVSIYPNPTNGIINVELSNNNTHQLTISDIMGKILVKRTTDEQNKTINLSNFESGIYIISIQTDKEIFKTKIIKR